MQPNPFALLGARSLDPLKALEEVCAALTEGRAAEMSAARHVGTGLRRYIDGQEPSLERALGVAAGRGGRSKTVAARKAAERRRSLVNSAFDAMGNASRTHKARQLCALLQPGASAECPDPLRAWLAPLAREFANGISDRQILRLSGEVRRDTK